jgi:two-component system chemotaxis response regulator CheB
MTAPEEVRRGREAATQRGDLSVVAIAASAGGLQALGALLSDISADLPAAIVVVQHLDPRHRSMMAEILAKRTPLVVAEARDGEVLRPGHVRIAPPDRHLLINPDGTLSLSQSELVHFLRPSADLMFESAAAVFGKRVIAVVLTGTGSDGAMGVTAVKKMGGIVIAQDEASSDFFGMPGAAIRTGAVDMVLPLAEIPAAITALVREVHVDG